MLAAYSPPAELFPAAGSAPAAITLLTLSSARLKAASGELRPPPWQTPAHRQSRGAVGAECNLESAGHAIVRIVEIDRSHQVAIRQRGEAMACTIQW